MTSTGEPVPDDSPNGVDPRHHRGKVAAVVLVVVLLAGAGAIAVLAHQRSQKAAAQEADRRYCAGLRFREAGGRIESILFMEPAAKPASIERMRAALADDKDLSGIEFVDKDQAYADFKRLFADQPAMLASVSPEVLPVSFRFVVSSTATEATVRARYATQPDVKRLFLAGAPPPIALDLLLATGADGTLDQAAPISDTAGVSTDVVTLGFRLPSARAAWPGRLAVLRHDAPASRRDDLVAVAAVSQRSVARPSLANSAPAATVRAAKRLRIDAESRCGIRSRVLLPGD